jgi:hypothetical protein
MMMRDMRSFGVRLGIVAAMAVATGCGGQPTDLGESDVDATIQRDNARPSLKPQNAGGTAGALPQNKLLPNDGAARDEFGVSVGIAGSTAVVGAIYDDDLGGDAG